MRTLIDLDPANPQPGQRWQEDDQFCTQVYTLICRETDGKYAGEWLYEESRTAKNTGSIRTSQNHIGDYALRNNIKDDAPRPELTAFDIENIKRDLHFEAAAARIDAVPLPPMPRLEYDWQCLDCGHAWRGRKQCPICGEGNDIIHWVAAE